MAIPKRIDIAIDPATLRLFAQKARAIAVDLDTDGDDGNDHEIEFDAERLTDRHAHDGLAEEESEDMTSEELIELIEDLNVDEAADLVAVIWVGRGDYEASDWDEAVAQARERAIGSTARYLIGMPLLADHLENGLDTLGL